MNTAFNRTVFLAKAAFLAGMAVAAAGAQAQVSSTPLSVRTDQSLVGVAVGNSLAGGSPIADVSGNGRPAVGVGAGSGKADHFGSAGSVSVANDQRLLGVDGAGGVNSKNSVSVPKPR